MKSIESSEVKVQRSSDEIKQDIDKHVFQYWLPGLDSGSQGAVERELEALDIELEEALKTELGEVD